MPSSFSFLQNSQSNSSSSSLENDSKSDQSEEENDNHINIGHYKTRTIQNDMLERPSDSDDSCSQSDITDNNDDDDDDDDEKENDLFTSSNKSRSQFLTRQLTLYENDWPKKISIDENKFKKSIYRGEATLLETQQDNTLFLDSNQHQLFSPERNKLVGNINTKHQSRNIHTSTSSSSSSSDFKMSTHELHLKSESDTMQTISTLSQTKISPQRTLIINEDKRQNLSKIPIRTNSSSQSRSRSPTTIKTNRHIQSPINSSKIPISTSAINKGAFRFFTANDRSSSSSLSQLPPTIDSGQNSNQTMKKISPFTPITHPKTLLSSKKFSSSAGNTPPTKHRHIQLPSSDDDSETNNLEEADLKLKLKEHKRHGKQTGELLNKLHENYEELLEKYAQAENTIDQLRFQPKIYETNTPPVNASEGTIHFVQQPKVHIATLQPNGVYHSTNGTPLSSIRQVSSTTSNTTTATTTAVKSSSSSANSGTIESVFFDEPIPQKIIVQELTTPETIKLDLLIQTKTLIEKMKSFLTLMDANQLSLAEQKQVYENIKDDYEKLLKTFDQTKHSNDLHDIDFDADLNQELETMKQLLKEIVKRITDNLLGKSSNSSETGHLTREGSHLSQGSTQSSLCNHADLIDQYKKILNAVNTDTVEKKNDITSLYTGSRQMKKTTSHNSSQSDISNHLLSTTKNQKPYVYISGNSDDEQQQISDTTPVPLMKGVESTSFSVDYIPSTSTKYHQQINEEQTHIRGITTAKKKSSNKQTIQEYDNLENINKTKRKVKTEQKKIKNNYQTEKELTPSSFSMPTGTTRHSANSMRTRTSDYDSGIGTNNTTKLSRDSKLNTSTIDESHYQSLDEERRRYSDEEQESISNISLTRSSGSGAASPGSPYNKYTKRFNRSLPLKQLNENRRRKPSGHSDVYPSDLETHITGSFDTFPQSTSSKKKSRHNWQPQRTNTRRSRLTPFQRSFSTDSIDIDNYKTSLHRPQTAPQFSSKTVQYYNMNTKYQSGFIHQPTKSSKQSETMYKSSCYIDQAHTHRKSQEKLNQNLKQYQKPIQTLNKQQTNNLYLDPQTGIVYRYIQDKTKPSTITYYQPTSQTKSSKELYRCAECGSITTYHHRHHTNSTTKKVTIDLDDPGYESGNRKVNRYRRHIDRLTSSESDSDDNPNYNDMSVLNEAYERAKKVQEHSQNLSRYISRQLKLVLATI
ncbi:unnamed protein product [Rotaria sordida]|uniref:Uncharacterized protein n=1 Tax=Rotaria sordida TaxID=392033 RepID=A0A818SA74_9BILA|nr:unnamed protein product [Rotaria sordida]